MPDLWILQYLAYVVFLRGNTLSTSYSIIFIINHLIATPDRKVHGANTGPTWVLSAPGGPHVGPMNLAIRDSIEPYSTNLYVCWGGMEIQGWMMELALNHGVPNCRIPTVSHFGSNCMYSCLLMPSKSYVLYGNAHFNARSAEAR